MSADRDTQSAELVILSDGSVSYTERFTVRVPVDFDLSDYPFDRQQIRLVVSSSWDRRHVLYRANEAPPAPAGALEISGWTVGASSFGLVDTPETAETAHSAIAAVVAITRKPAEAIKTTIVPLILMLIVLTLVAHTEIDGRIQSILVALLAFVAFHTIIADDLPGLDEIVILDVLVFLGYAMAVVSLAEAVVVQRLSGDETRSALVARVERWNRIGVAAGALLLLGFALIAFT